MKYATATLYKTVSNDVKEILTNKEYDMIVFFSPSGVKSLFEALPEVSSRTVPGSVLSALLTSAAVEEAGLRLDVKAPAPQAPSMVAALEQYLAELNKK